MRLVPTLGWRLDADTPEALDPRLLPLLEAVAADESLSAAVVACGVSYRAAWGMLREYQHKLNAPLVEMQRGRGARLAPAGARLLDAHRAANARLARALAALSVDVGEAAGPERAKTPYRLRIAASHDLALAALRDAQQATGLVLDLAFMGSLDALRQFDEGRVDVAGFHVASDKRGRLSPFLRCLRAGRDRLIPLVEREQGLILPRGNPARVRSFRDLARKGLRFVNRQQGSGTRLLVEQMLADERVAPESLRGYASEEFTHPAVAATVASGAADAGFGLRAAAAELRLAFIPCLRERYYLAARASAIAAPALGRLIEVLDGPVFAGIVRGLPGYRRKAAAGFVRVGDLSAPGKL